MKLVAEDLTTEGFATFGRLIERPARSEDAAGPGWKWWAETALLDHDGRPFGVGYLDLTPGPATFDWAERHMRSLDKNAHEIQDALDKHFNAWWGRLLKSNNELSRFGAQVELYACTYTSKVSNFLRYSPVQTLEQLKMTVEEILRRHGVRYTLEWYVSGEPFYTPPGLLCAAVGDAVAQVTGARPKLSTGGGTSDGRFIAPLGAEVVELGVLNASIHKVNECVRVTDIEALHRMYVNVLRRLLG